MYGLILSESFFLSPDLSVGSLPIATGDQNGNNALIMEQRARKPLPWLEMTKTPLIATIGVRLYFLLFQIWGNYFRVFFSLDAPGGTVKMLTLDATMYRLASDFYYFFACCYSAVTARLLRRGATSHFPLRIPVQIDYSSTCNMSTRSSLSELLRNSNLII